VNEHQSELVRAALGPTLEDGEQVEVVCSATVGSISVARMMGTAVVVAAVTAGTLIALRMPKKLYVGLTDRRLIFLEGNFTTGRPTSKVALQLARLAPRQHGHVAAKAWHWNLGDPSRRT
jgi:hypothetical protein